MEQLQKSNLQSSKNCLKGHGFTILIVIVLLLLASGMAWKMWKLSPIYKDGTNNYTVQYYFVADQVPDYVVEQLQKETAVFLDDGVSAGIIGDILVKTTDPNTGLQKIMLIINTSMTYKTADYLTSGFVTEDNRITLHSSYWSLSGNIENLVVRGIKR